MKIINLQHFKWYRYLGQSPVVLPEAHAEYDIEIETREIFGARYDIKKKKFWLVHPDLPEEELPVDKADIEVLITNSRPYTGDILGIGVPKGVPFDQILTPLKPVERKSSTDIKGRAVKGDDIIKSMPVQYVSITNRSKPKQTSIKIDSIKESQVGIHGTINPLSPRLMEMLDDASKYIGLLKPIKANVIKLAEGTRGSMLLTKTNKRFTKSIFIVIDAREIASLNGGKLDASILAQVITHELGHYILSEGVVRTSDVMRWKKKLAGLRFHKDQYNHGQGYPWWEEHFAMVCEYMVHGRSARNLQSNTGWEIVEKYFYNEYMPNGEPKGK